MWLAWASDESLSLISTSQQKKKKNLKTHPIYVGSIHRTFQKGKLQDQETPRVGMGLAMAYLLNTVVDTQLHIFLSA